MWFRHQQSMTNDVVQISAENDKWCGSDISKAWQVIWFRYQHCMARDVVQTAAEIDKWCGSDNSIAWQVRRFGNLMKPVQLKNLYTLEFDGTLITNSKRGGTWEKGGHDGLPTRKRTWNITYTYYSDICHVGTSCDTCIIISKNLRTHSETNKNIQEYVTIRKLYYMFSRASVI